MRRSLGVALWTLVGLLACFLGALNALVGTHAGRTLLARVASSVVEGAVNGSIEVGEVRGSLLTGVVLTDVRLLDPDSTLVAWLPRAELGYNPIDFAAGRVVFMEVRLERPSINIVQHANGKTNFDELLRLGEKDTVTVKPLGPAGRRSLILLRNVQIQDGSLTLRLQKHGQISSANEEIEFSGEDGRYRVRRFEHLNARLAAMRIQAPREKGIRIVATESTDPKLSIADVVGRVTIDGHTLDVDLSRVRFPATQFRARGTVQWPRDTLLWNVVMQADSATLTDIRFLDPRFPEHAVLHGGVTLASHGGRLLEIQLQPLDLSFGQGRLTGHVNAFSAADSGLVALRQGDLVARELSLDFARVYIDSLPFYGRLTGRTIVDGPMSALRIETEWSFRDSLVPGWPESQILGKGEISVAGRDVAFQPFAVETGRIDIGTVRRLVPGFDLQGELDASGTLTGTLKNAMFSGTLRHHDGDRNASIVRGVVGLDSRTDVLGVFADVHADSLSLDGLTGRVAAFPLRGALAGTIRLNGDLTGVETHADLAMLGGGGAVRGDGTLLLGARDMHPGFGARDFTLHAQDLNLQRWLTRGSAPPSRLTFTVTGSVAADSTTKPTGELSVLLAPSLFAGTIIDSGATKVRFAGGKLVVDSLRLQQPGLLTSGRGSLGWRRPDRGTLTFGFEADSLGVLDSLVTWLAGPNVASAFGEDKLKGSAQVRMSLDGALDSLSVGGDAHVLDLRWRGWRVPKGEGTIAYQPGPLPRFDVEANADSIGYGRFGFGLASVHARGTRDSLAWFARSRVGDLGAFLAGGRYAQPGGSGTRHAVLDSLAVLLPSGVWFLERPTALAFGDSVLHLDSAALRSAGGAGRLSVSGDLPARGPINARVSLDSFPLTGVYALLQSDTLGVAGAVTANIAATGTRANPLYSGSFAASNAAFGSFRAPFLDGIIDYRNRRLNGEVHLWRSGQQVLNVIAHLPLDLALEPVAQRQLPDTLSVQARADSVDLGVLAAVTTTVQQVEGVFNADLGIGGTCAERALYQSERRPVPARRHDSRGQHHGNERTRPRRADRLHATGAAHQAGTRVEHHHFGVQGARSARLSRPHSQRPRRADGSRVRRGAHGTRHRYVGGAALRRSRQQARREPRRALGPGPHRHVADPHAAARPGIPEPVLRQPAGQEPAAEHGRGCVVEIERSEHPALGVGDRQQGPRQLHPERHAAGAARHLSVDHRPGDARVRRATGDGAVLRHAGSRCRARHRSESHRPSVAGTGTAAGDHRDRPHRGHAPAAPAHAPGQERRLLAARVDRIPAHRQADGRSQRRAARIHRRRRGIPAGGRAGAHGGLGSRRAARLLRDSPRRSEQPVFRRGARGGMGNRREDVPRAQRGLLPAQPPGVAVHERPRRHAAVPVQSRVAHRGELRARAQLLRRP